MNLHRKFNFLHSGRTHEGVPIIASNMDTVGTFEMASALAKVSQSVGDKHLWIHNPVRSDRKLQKSCKFILECLYSKVDVQICIRIASNKEIVLTFLI